ncbi:MAG TPA: hypothetical protein DIT13_04735 [Verrucomicrobiales bacterium]|nr:hypothetical protein [Verrucomicrobiales bacterium]HRJ09364.1 hypothetical protein [Prosthecobacter sp.]HRK15052.1 hypothetical protein [Prosthecobacter sp.]
MKLEELTQDLDRKNGRRVIRVTDAGGDERVTMTLEFESNTSLPDEAPRYGPVDHPPANSKVREYALELLAALHKGVWRLDLTGGPGAA